MIMRRRLCTGVAETRDLLQVMAMEHVHDHVYGIQWHPEVGTILKSRLQCLCWEVINSKVGRKIIDRIFSLVGP